MRALILIAGAGALALALGACGNKDQTDNMLNVDESLTAENIVSNDVTAIDAVTGDAANMAAEADVNDVGAPLPNTATATKPAPKRPSGAGASIPNTAANKVTNAAGNAAQ